jgi:hypothetical protein
LALWGLTAEIALADLFADGLIEFGYSDAVGEVESEALALETGSNFLFQMGVKREVDRFMYHGDQNDKIRLQPRSDPRRDH